MEFRETAHLLAFLAVISYAPGNSTIIPKPKIPELYGFGWPNVTLVTASVETVRAEGIVQYDLFSGSFCPYDSLDGCSSNVTDLIPVHSCSRVENDASPLSTKVFSCNVCNNTKRCESLGISKGQYFCVYLKVTTSNGSVYSACQGQSFLNILIFPPPKTLQLLPVSRRQLTVLWERPEGIEPSEVQILYKVILRDHLGQCQDTIKEIYGERTFRNTYIYTSLMPWSRYSVIVCSGLMRVSIKENTTACTCGNFHHQPRGPVFSQTLPEEPTERPDVQPCEARCSETNFTATLKWKAGEKLIWNGIPKESVIRIYTLNSSSHSIARTDQNKLGSLVRTFHVPLEADYNGSLARFSVSLNNQWNYLYKVQFCSNGGCGPSAEGVLSCDACTLLGVPSAGAITEKPPTGEDSYWLAIIAGVTFFFLGAIVILWILNRKRRQTNRQSLQETLGSLPPGNVYEYPDLADMTQDSGNYNQLYESETRLLHIDQQEVQQV